MNKNNVTMLPVEAYSLPSSYGMANSTHVFVVAKNDRQIQWTNGGGGWGDSRSRTLVDETTLYYEWANTFLPRPTGYNHGGISFGINGVCHTIANRVLLVANSSANAGRADKDEYCVLFYGKYGLGLKQLKALLTESFHQTQQNYNLPDYALSQVLSRVDGYLNDEAMAWKTIAQRDIGIDVDGIVRRSGGIEIARRRLQEYVSDREALYEKYLSNKLNRHSLQQEMKQAMLKRSGDYLDYLARLSLITQTDNAVFHTRVNAFLNQFIQGTNAQLAALQNGRLL